MSAEAGLQITGFLEFGAMELSPKGKAKTRCIC